MNNFVWRRGPLETSPPVVGNITRARSIRKPSIVVGNFFSNDRNASDNRANVNVFRFVLRSSPSSLFARRNHFVNILFLFPSLPSSSVNSIRFQIHRRVSTIDEIDNGVLDTTSRALG